MKTRNPNWLLAVLRRRCRGPTKIVGEHYQPLSTSAPCTHQFEWNPSIRILRPPNILCMSWSWFCFVPERIISLAEYESARI